MPGRHLQHLLQRFFRCGKLLGLIGDYRAHVMNHGMLGSDLRRRIQMLFGLIGITLGQRYGRQTQKGAGIPRGQFGRLGIIRFRCREFFLHPGDLGAHQPDAVIRRAQFFCLGDIALGAGKIPSDHGETYLPQNGIHRLWV